MWDPWYLHGEKLGVAGSVAQMQSRGVLHGEGCRTLHGEEFGHSEDVAWRDAKQGDSAEPRGHCTEKNLWCRGGCRVKQRCMQRNAGRKEVLHGGTFGAARDGAWGRTWCCSDSTGLQSCVTRICSIHPHPLTVLQHLLQQRARPPAHPLEAGSGLPPPLRPAASRH